MGICKLCYQREYRNSRNIKHRHMNKSIFLTNFKKSIIIIAINKSKNKGRISNFRTKHKLRLRQKGCSYYSKYNNQNVYGDRSNYQTDQKANDTSRKRWHVPTSNWITGWAVMGKLFENIHAEYKETQIKTTQKATAQNGP